MKLAGRKKEVKLLNHLLEKDESEFVAVYGRRRVGKTFLIKNVLSSRTFSILTARRGHITGVN